MLLSEVLLLSLKIAIACAFDHEKPVPLKLWPGRCTKGSAILNDCNWCRCDAHQKYVCKARVCHEIDMFGHFNDAIRDLNVGMEGHGAWRSTETACEPLIQYERGSMLCVCGEDGNWPNPVCRDEFRVLHEVDISKQNQDLIRQKCVPNKLYLFGCNVCFCPETEYIDSQLCTKRNCSNEDPINYSHKIIERIERPQDKSLELYAECNLNRKYRFGCRNCTCLRNNRLLCDKCSSDHDPIDRGIASRCDNVASGQVFNMDCNLCVCDKGLVYCTSKRCLGISQNFNLNNLRDDLTSVESPFDDLDCNPGTIYHKDCNTCFCSKTDDGQKTYGCTLKQCLRHRNPLDVIKSDCVEDTIYESNCQICRCHAINGVKTESCHGNYKCSGVKALKEPRALNIDSMHGYCEPGHTYQKDCNTCRCLADGQVIMCTSHVCEEISQPIAVDIVPVSQRDGSPCPKDHMYKVDCNYCFCLSNGNALCTTAVCGK